jgi:hypothetical protein
MDNLKVMPVRDRFRQAFEGVRLYQKRVLPFVEQRLGYAAKHELESIWQAAFSPIHDSDSDEEKYARAYACWLWMARSSHDLLADHLDREGVADYKRLLLRSYKRQHHSPNLAIYYWLDQPTSLLKSWAYKMQWITPIAITHNGAGKFVCEVRNCKVLQTPAMERVCKVDCWNVGTELAWQVYHLERHTSPVDHGCRITLTYFEE